MLIIGLLGAMFFYVVLYLIFTSTQTPLNTLESWLRAFDSMLWTPQLMIFALMRWVIILALVYVVADLFISKARKTRRLHLEKKRDAEEPFELRIKPPIVD